HFFVSIAAVVLAGGASRRLGQLKQLVRLGRETLLERSVRVAREAGCLPVVVVLGAAHEQVIAGCSLGDVVTATNEEWEEGMGSSIRLGVHAVRNVAPETEGVVVMTCDQPAVTVNHLRRLIMSGEVRASRYADRSGVPAFFPKTYFDALTSLTGDAGARELLQSSSSEELPGGELDVDTADDLKRARELFG
ncbi:MAG TPA: nucleotidyltransferase family protein, partial [Edaphobacter sp.]